MVQYGVPISGSNHPNWSEGIGDGDTDHFDELDEGFGAGRGSGSGPDDSTSYWVNDGTFGILLQCDINDVTDPLTGSGHKVRGRHRKNSSGGRQIDITHRLDEGPTFISQKKFFNVTAVWTTEEFTFPVVDADDITDYTNIQTGSYCQEVGGGGPRIPWVSTQEFECPDVGGGGGFAHSQGVIVG